MTELGEAPGGAKARPLLPGTVRSPASGGLVWDQTEPHVSVDLAPLLNELAKQPGGLAKGAHVQLWLWGERPAGRAEVFTPVYEQDPASSARLRLCP